MADCVRSALGPWFDFVECFCRHVSQFAGLDMRVSLPNHLFRIIEIPSRYRVPERADKHLTHPSATTVRGKIIVFRMSDVDLCGLREPMEN